MPNASVLDSLVSGATKLLSGFTDKAAETFNIEPEKKTEVVTPQQPVAAVNAPKPAQPKVPVEQKSLDNLIVNTDLNVEPATNEQIQADAISNLPQNTVETLGNLAEAFRPKKAYVVQKPEQQPEEPEQQPELNPSVNTQDIAKLEEEFNQWKADREANAPKDRFGQEIERRLYNPDGSMAAPWEWNLLGFTSQRKTDDIPRSVYESHFAQEDANGVRNEDALSTKWTNKEDPFGNKPMRYDLIDDGASPESREGLYMTGEQYLKYRNEYGMPGRDIEDINPDEIYSKQDEQDNYGFIPYLASDEGLQQFHDDAASVALSNIFKGLGDLRRNNTDFTLDYDGEQYSGKDFSKNVRLWEQRQKNIPQEEINSRFTQDPSKAEEYAIPQAWIMKDENGAVHLAPNEPVGIFQNEDGSIVVQFDDDPKNDWVFDNQDDYENSTDTRPAQDGEWVVGWMNQDPLVLDSGQVIRADKANDLWSNLDQYADYGNFDLGRPSVNNPIEEGGWAPWLVDMALSSAPYFWTIPSFVKATGDAATNMTGMRAGYDDYLNGTYSLVSEDPTFLQRDTAALGSAIMPLTERIWGPLGNAMFKMSPTEAIANKILHIPESALSRPFGRWLTGASDEGFEEIPGNLVEEFQLYGTDAFNDDKIKRDENGNIVLNSKGEPVSDKDTQDRVLKQETDPLGRVYNFLEEAPLSYLGGLVLGGALGTKDVPKYRREYAAQKDEIEKHGFQAHNVVDLEALRNAHDFSDAMLSYYDR